MGCTVWDRRGHRNKDELQNSLKTKRNKVVERLSQKWVRILVTQDQKTYFTFLSDTNTLINLCDLAHNLSLPISSFFSLLHVFLPFLYFPILLSNHFSLSYLFSLILSGFCLDFSFSSFTYLVYFFPVLSYRFVFMFLLLDWGKQLFIYAYSYDMTGWITWTFSSPNNHF